MRNENELFSFAIITTSSLTIVLQIIISFVGLVSFLFAFKYVNFPLQEIIHTNSNHDHRFVRIQFRSVYDVALCFSVFHVLTFLSPYKHLV